jgi:hypothetical protein
MRKEDMKLPDQIAVYDRRATVTQASNVTILCKEAELLWPGLHSYKNRYVYLIKHYRPLLTDKKTANFLMQKYAGNCYTILPDGTETDYVDDLDEMTNLELHEILREYIAPSLSQQMSKADKKAAIRLHRRKAEIAATGIDPLKEPEDDGLENETVNSLKVMLSGMGELPGSRTKTLLIERIRELRKAGGN